MASPNISDASGRYASAPVFGYRVVASFPHDPTAFTQGLVYVDGQLFESTGNYGESLVRRVDLVSGRVEQETALAADLFGEGLTEWNGRLILLTWREQRGLIFDMARLEMLESFDYAGEGWGLTHDGRHLIMSDGTSVLRFLDPESRRLVRQLPVYDGGRAIQRLNELEFIGGEIWANVWKKDYIVRISPATGAVTGYIDLKGIQPASELTDAQAVLNGIAHDPETGRLFVTGKYWPRLFEIQLVPGQPSLLH